MITNTAALSAPTIQQTTKKLKFYKRLINSSFNYAKNIYTDYFNVFNNLIIEARLRPVKTIFIGSSLCFFYYAYKTNPTKKFFYENLTDFRQELILVPQSIQNKRALNALNYLTELANKNCIDYYDFIFASLIVKRNYDKRCNLYVTQDSNLKKWFWDDLWENTIDVGAFNKFWNLNKKFKNYDVVSEDEEKEF